MKRIRTLCYHKISNDHDDLNNTHVSLKNFEEQIEWLSNTYNMICLENIGEEIERPGGDSIAISFDDGYADVYRNALPILEKYNVPATIFISTSNIDTEYPNYTERIIEAILKPAVFRDYFEIDDGCIQYRWHTSTLAERLELYKAISCLFCRIATSKRKEYEVQLYEWAGIADVKYPSKRVLSKEEILLLARNPLISIGSHTVNHASLKWISKEQQAYEICESKKQLEGIINHPINMFAYPWGSLDDYSNDTIEILRQNGYKSAFTTQNIESEGKWDPYQIPRWTVCNYVIADFKNFITQHVFRDIQKSQIIDRVACSENQEGKPIVYIGSIELDSCLLNSDCDIVVWGYGYNGKALFNKLQKIGIGNRVVAFGDNDTTKIGLRYNGIEVRNLEGIMSVKERKDNLHFLLAGNYCWEICTDLTERGFRNIHIYV